VKTISALPARTEIQPTDLFVVDRPSESNPALRTAKVLASLVLPQSSTSDTLPEDCIGAVDITLVNGEETTITVRLTSSSTLNRGTFWIQCDGGSTYQSGGPELTADSVTDWGFSPAKQYQLSLTVLPSSNKTTKLYVCTNVDINSVDITLDPDPVVTL
jgi:hypothetical protein